MPIIAPTARAFATACLLLGAALSFAEPPRYSVSVPALDSGRQDPIDLNKMGAMVAEVDVRNIPIAHLCSDDGCRPIPSLDADQVDNPVYARAMNNAGWVVGISPTKATMHGFLFDGYSTFDVGAFAEDDCGGCSLISYANGINGRGQVVGMSQTADGTFRAFRWTAGVMKKLPTLGGAFSQAFAINDHGHVVGSAGTRRGQTHAFLLRHGVMLDLGVLGSGEFSEALAINNQGQVIGNSATVPGGSPEGFIYEDGIMRAIPPPQGGYALTAYDINAKGQVVGANLPGPIGFMFDGTSTYDLNLLLSKPDQDDWFVLSAEAINSKGQIAAVGRSKKDNIRRVILLTPMGTSRADH